MRWRLLAAFLAPMMFAGCSERPEWVGKAKDVGALIGMDHYAIVLGDVLKGRTWAVECRAYDFRQRHYALCLPVAGGVDFEKALNMKGMPWILLEWADGQVWPVNGTTDAALSRYARVRLGLGREVREFTILDTKVHRAFRYDGGPQAYEIVNAIRAGEAKRVD